MTKQDTAQGMRSNSQDGMRIEYMPVDKLVRALRNPKQHDIGTISQSMERFGYTAPLMINEATGKLIAGHGRLDTLQRMKVMGEKAPERIVVQNGQWYVPVIRGVSFESEQEAEAYLMADNRLTEIGGWNELEEAQVLADLAAQGEEMLRGVGFDMDDVDELLKKIEKDTLDNIKNSDEVEEEQLPEAEALLEKWDVQPGDLWEAYGNIVYCADSVNDETSWERAIKASGANKVAGIFTSPPYAQQRSKANVPNYEGIPEELYVDWFTPLQESAAKFLDPYGSFFLNIKPNVVDGERVLYVMDLVLAMVRNFGWRLIEEFCWERVGAPGRWPNRFKNAFEPIYQFAMQTDIIFNPEAVASDEKGSRTLQGNKSTGGYYNVDNKTMEWDHVMASNRIPTFGNAIGALHPAAFPVQLPEFFMRAFSDRGSLWLDPFSGSGTVAIAAMRNNRHAVLIESQPKYVAVSLERMVNAAGPDRSGYPKKIK